MVNVSNMRPIELFVNHLLEEGNLNKAAQFVEENNNFENGYGNEAVSESVKRLGKEILSAQKFCSTGTNGNVWSVEKSVREIVGGHKGPGAQFFLRHLQAQEQKKQDLSAEAADAPKLEQPMTVEVQKGVLFEEEKLGKELESLTRGRMSVIHVKEFFARGGRINFVQPGEKVALPRDTNYLVGCSAGECRSAALAGFLDKTLDLPVLGVVAGADSAFNPFAIYSYGEEPPEEARLIFKEVYGLGKPAPVGAKEFPGYEPDKLEAPRAFFQAFVQGLPNNLHVIAFAHTLSSTINRLLATDKPLKNVTITYLNWRDTISRPDVDGVTARSVEAYQEFNKKLESVFGSSPAYEK